MCKERKKQKNLQGTSQKKLHGIEVNQLIKRRLKRLHGKEVKQKLIKVNKQILIIKKQINIKSLPNFWKT